MIMASHRLLQNVEIETTLEADASGVVSTISTDCTIPTPTAFAPSIAYNLTWAAPVATAASTPSATAALTGPINLDTNPAVTTTLNASGAPGGFVLFVNQSPKMKIGGIQCQLYSQSKLEVNGDGVDNLSFDIAIQHLSDSDTIYTAANKVDNVPAASKAVLWGAGGQIVTSNLVDGSDEDSTTANGDVVFGGSVEAKGGSEMHVILDVTNYSPASATDQETLTYTFTPF